MAQHKYYSIGHYLDKENWEKSRHFLSSFSLIDINWMSRYTYLKVVTLLSRQFLHPCLVISMHYVTEILHLNPYLVSSMLCRESNMAACLVLVLPGYDALLFVEIILDMHILLSRIFPIDKKRKSRLFPTQCHYLGCIGKSLDILFILSGKISTN